MEEAKTARSPKKNSERKKSEGTAPVDKREYKETILLFIKILVTIFLCEAAIMTLLYILPLKSGWSIVADPLLLTFLGTPVLYWLLVRPVWHSLEERTRAVEALKSERDFAESLITTTQAIVLLLDSEGRIEHFNPYMEQISGYRLDEVKGKDWFTTFLPERDQKRTRELFSKARGGIQTCGNINPIVTKDGCEREIEWYDKILKDANGNVAGVLATGQDITERKRAEEALRESEMMNRSLLEGSPVCNKIIDLDFKLQYMSAAGLKQLKIPDIKPYYGQTYPPKFYPEPMRAPLIKNLKLAMAGKISTVEAPVHDMEGNEVWYHTTFVPALDDDGRVKYVIGSSMDITERKKSEQKILLNQAQLKSLASQLSLIEERERHRLATELHDQIGQSLVASKMKLDELQQSATSSELTKTLEEVCKSIGQVIVDTRSLTFDLSYPILYELGFEAAVAEWLREQIHEKHGIETKFEDDRQPKPLSDDIRALLFRNVRELLINVVKHANAQNVKVSILKIDERICVSVQDDGVGFDPAEVASLAVENAGFGIFSIRERLEQLGGHLEIESEPDRGSKITMTAPLK